MQSTWFLNFYEDKKNILRYIMEPETYYKIYRKTNFDWIEYVNRCHKWTQTNSNCSRVTSKASGLYSDLLLQAEVNRVVDLYNLTGSRDYNTKKAIADVIDHQCYFEDNVKIRKLLRRKIGRKCTQRKYQNKKKNMIHTKLKDGIADTKDNGEHITTAGDFSPKRTL